MDIDKILEVMKNFEASNMSKLEIEAEGLKIKLEKESTKEVQQVVMATPVMQNVEMPKAETKVEVSGTEVKAPLVGVYYAQASANAAPYVTVGQSVKAGDTLCIIEAMKVMNEIKAPCNGIVREIKVQNEDFVEFDQVIMVIGD